MVYAPLILEESAMISETRSIELVTTESYVFNTLTESVGYVDIIQESKIGEFLKGIWKKIIAAIRWLKDKLKEIWGKIKEFFNKRKDKEKNTEKFIDNIDAEEKIVNNFKSEEEIDEFFEKEENKAKVEQMQKELEKFSNTLKGKEILRKEREANDIHKAIHTKNMLKKKYSALNQLRENPLARFNPYDCIEDWRAIDNSRAYLSNFMDRIKSFVMYYDEGEKDKAKERLNKTLEEIKTTYTDKVLFDKLLIINSRFLEGESREDQIKSANMSITGSLSHLAEDINKELKDKKFELNKVKKNYYECKKLSGSFDHVVTVLTKFLSDFEASVNSLMSTDITYTYKDEDKEERTLTAKDLDTKKNPASGITKEIVDSYNIIVRVCHANINTSNILTSFCNRTLGMYDTIEAMSDGTITFNKD